MVKHKHAEVIHAWADGAMIQCRWRGSNWETMTATPTWDKEFEYRIKPERVYPETKMEESDLDEVWRTSSHIGIVAVANAAIKHAIDSHQVFVPEWADAVRDIRDMAIAEAVRDACVATISRFINIPGNLIFVPDLAVVIATVK